MGVRRVVADDPNRLAKTFQSPLQCTHFDPSIPLCFLTFGPTRRDWRSWFLGGMTAWQTNCSSAVAVFATGRRSHWLTASCGRSPAPPKALGLESEAFGIEYVGLIQAVREAESLSELRLAELSLAIFLLGENYSLSSSEYERLLGFMPGSQELAEWQNRFHRIAEQHLESMAGVADGNVHREPVAVEQGWVTRRLVWVRNRLPTRWWLFNS